MNPYKPISQVLGLSRHCFWEKVDLRVNPQNMQNTSANIFSLTLDIKDSGQAQHLGVGKPQSSASCSPSTEHSPGPCVGAGGVRKCFSVARSIIHE